MRNFNCPFVNAEVELTDEREQHIIETHPGTLPDYLEQLAETLAEPDQIRRSDLDLDAMLFSKWFDTTRTGRYLVVVVVRQTETERYWIVTTYTARKITGGTVIWTKA
ncbi:hypothetical protein [Leptolyngbya sp. FACHB-17]|uniref:hypothetical protein n=1 Tax=unclassified Leptolyngbya TaxID=2650499 RepID=UPI00168197AF|nr:hypothetical protein [Leptolyngbya sp. FACHB-17]MBD2082757.1 hypothetical protein [Leptolyngbya sp. FACHB-17]